MMTDTVPEVVMVNSVAHDLFCHSKGHSPLECREIKLAMVQERFGQRLNLAIHIASCMKHHRPQKLKAITINGKTWRVYLSRW